jgi:subtilisin family serine protease
MFDVRNVAVAVIDTGVSADRLPAGTLLSGVNLSGEGSAEDSSDSNGHGTAVAATILSIAPRTRIVPIKLLGTFGYLRKPDHLELAFEWIREHRDRLAMRVVCAAFADGSHLTSDEPFRTSPLQSLVAALRADGVVTVAPAGTWFRPARRWSEQGMAWPAILREVVSVGAFRDNGEGERRLTDNTQRLHAAIGGACHTTLFAESMQPKETSGAAAVVAGHVAALLFESPSSISVDTLVERLLEHCDDAWDENGTHWPALMSAPAPAQTWST